MTGIQNDLLEMTADIVSAYVTKNVVTAENLPDVITSVHAALSKVSTQGLEEPKVELKPAVPVAEEIREPRFHHLPRGWEEIQIFEAAPAKPVRPYAGGIPREVGLAEGLSDGGPCLRRCPV